MTGLELSRAYFEKFARPMLEREFPEYIGRIAAGLVGHGSECFGFDDEISRDHDFDAGFSFWITKEDEQKFGFRLERAYAHLPREFMGIKLGKKSLFGNESKGVHTIDEFYSQYTGSLGAPETWQQWLYTPSEYLAEATNGEVFCDPLGEFTRIRKQIMFGMPEDVRLKKIASKALLMAQTGQYNFKRCLLHNELAAAEIALARFAEHTAEMVFLLNYAYAPYYKWVFRAIKNLPTLSEKGDELTQLLTDKSNNEKRISAVESICSDVIKALAGVGVQTTLGDYLEPYAYAVNEKIENPEIRNLHILQP